MNTSESHSDISRSVTPVILAGGLGTRIAGVLGKIPKVLAPVKRRPFIYYLLDQLVAAGHRKAVICTGHQAELVEGICRQYPHAITLTFSREHTPLGTGGALRQALDDVSTPFILGMNGDSYTDSDLEAYARWFITRDADLACLLVEVPDTGRYGRVTVNPQKEIIGFSEKGQGGPGLINAGLYLIDVRAFRHIEVRTPVSMEHDVLETFALGRVFGYATPGRFIDIGTPSAYAGAGDFFSTTTDGKGAPA